MTYSPLSSAFEGFRLIARRPVSFVAWYVAIGLIIGLAVLTSIAVPRSTFTYNGVQIPRPGPSPLSGLLSWAEVFMGLTIVACAVYRAVLRPDERAFAYLRLGGGELRVMGITAALTGLFLLPFIALGLGLSVLGAAIGNGGGLVGLALIAAWVIPGVRLSMAPPIALVERRRSLAGSWRLSHQRFWGLLGLWTIVLIVSLLVWAAGVVMVDGVLEAVFGALRISPLSPPATIAASAVFLPVLMVLWAAAAAAAYRGLTAPEATPVEVFD